MNSNGALIKFMPANKMTNNHKYIDLVPCKGDIMTNNHNYEFLDGSTMVHSARN